MPLRDHFRPPLSLRRHWHAFHNAWATFLASDLNRRLPDGYFAEGNVQFGIKIDGTDTVEVAVYNTTAGPVLAGAIELVSPANKDRPEHREAFVSKCATYLQQGVGLVVVDIVTERRANLHNELLRRFGLPGPAWDADLYAAAYHPVERSEQSSLDIWQEPLAVGRPLPTMPLWLRGAPYLPVDLEGPYERTCAEYRPPGNGS
jgi:hypothetical protein